MKLFLFSLIIYNEKYYSTDIISSISPYRRLDDGWACGDVGMFVAAIRIIRIIIISRSRE